MRLHTWLPASTPDSNNPLQIIKACGSHFYTYDGQRIYDAISSWWCKPLGHQHPLIKKAITEQLELFEHHIPADAYNNTIEKLSHQLVSIFSEMDKVVYASDGSSAIEIALKLSYESRVLTGDANRSKFIALKGAYHGETALALSVCGIEAYTKNFSALLPENYFIEDIVYIKNRQDSAWDQANYDFGPLEKFFQQQGPQISALIIEPIVQGANGLRIISKDFLQQLIKLAQRHKIHIIADEIMVGLGRLGCLSVSKSILDCEPDLVCFAKNLTAGAIPMSAVVVNHRISDIYRTKDKIFAHSHTHSCNALAAAIAVEYLNFLKNSDLLKQVAQAEHTLAKFSQQLEGDFPFILSSHNIGAIAAWELDPTQINISKIHGHALQLGLYLRPIGNILYLMPPLYNLQNDLTEILHIILKMTAEIYTPTLQS